MTLYELSKDYQDLFAMDVESPEDAEAFTALLSGIQASAADKVDNIGCLINTLAGEADTIKKEIDRLQAMKKVRESKIDRIKQYLQYYMMSTNEKMIQGSKYKAVMQKNQPALKIVDPDKIPDIYKHQVVEIDNSAVKDALKAGFDVTGAELTQSESLRIK